MAQAYKMLPPAQDLWELFDYKPLTGELVWRPSNTHARAGLVAGTISNNGYLAISIKSIKYKVHRITWSWITGEDPKNFQIDHINGDRLNNTWQNLRLATSSQNCSNCKRNKVNTTGIKGVKSPRNGKFRAQIIKKGICYYLGTFDTAEKAGAAYAAAALKLHGKFARVC